MYPYIQIGDTLVNIYSSLGFWSWFIMVVAHLFTISSKEKNLTFVSRLAINGRKWKREKLCVHVCAVLEIMALTSLFFFPGLELEPVWGKVTLGVENPNFFSFLYFSPIILVIACMFLSVSPTKQLDDYTPAIGLTLVVFKIACFCAGCCHGIEMEKGVYSIVNDRMEFPVQLLESFMGLCLFIVLIIYKNAKKTKPGTVYPMFLILYSATRFFTEFLRDDYPDVLGILNNYQIQCIVGVGVGILQFVFAILVAPKIKIFREGIRYSKLENYITELRIKNYGEERQEVNLKNENDG